MSGWLRLLGRDGEGSESIAFLDPLKTPINVHSPLPGRLHVVAGQAGVDLPSPCVWCSTSPHLSLCTWPRPMASMKQHYALPALVTLASATIYTFFDVLPVGSAR